jgi:hypothetical protein
MRRHEITDEQLDLIRRRVAHTQEVVTSLASIGELRPDELGVEVDLAEITRSVVRGLGGVAERDDVKVTVRVSPENGHPTVRRGAKAITVLTRELIAHAIEASPRGSSVDVTVVVADQGVGARLIIDDAGSALPASGRRAFLALETHAGAYGRPSCLPIFLAAELAACQGAMLELSDAPVKQGGADVSQASQGMGGLRVAVTFAA